MTIDEIKKRFDGVQYVRWHGKYYRLEMPLCVDINGRIGIIELKNTSNGIGVYPIDVWPAEPEQIEAIEWWREKGVVQ